MAGGGVVRMRGSIMARGLLEKSTGFPYMVNLFIHEMLVLLGEGWGYGAGGRVGGEEGGRG